MHIQFRLPVLFALLLSNTLALPALAANTAVSLAVEMPWSDIDLDAERKTVALAIDELFAGEEQEGPLGFALHPEFGMGKDHDFVYVAFSYAVKGRHSKIVQYQWDAEAGTLGDPIDLVSDAPVVGSVAHN